MAKPKKKADQFGEVWVVECKVAAMPWRLVKYAAFETKQEATEVMAMRALHRDAQKWRVRRYVRA